MPFRLAEARIVSGPSGKYLNSQRPLDRPSIDGVKLEQLDQFVDPRRQLIVTRHEGQAIEYVMILNAGKSVGDHSHPEGTRAEVVTVAYGEAEIRLCDLRSHGGTKNVLNVIHVEGHQPYAVSIPPGVAHTIIARSQPVVLIVHATKDYDPRDVERVELSAL
jgi:dTDP-4-dehydrorhamnose 3,5-epimerase-like enzyme